MIKTSVELLAEKIGFDIGASDDVVQSDLMNGFCKGMKGTMSDHDIDTQVCYVTDKLNSDALMILKKFAGFIELKEREIKN